MISFITMSPDPVLAHDQLVGNLCNVFGQEHTANQLDVVVIDGTKTDLFQGFNEGAQLATEDVLVFLHDDVRILANTECFQRPLELLKKPMTGVIGCAGSRLLPKDATWWNAPNEECWGMVAHPSKQGDFGIHWNTWPHHQARFGRVSVLDGCFLMMSRAFYERMGGFDSQNYRGFHFYDIDLTFRATLQGFVNYSAPIPIQHRSRGAVNENWEENRKKFLELHGKHLPYVIKE